MSIISKRIKDYRRHFNYSRKSVADYIGIESNTLYLYENGKETTPLPILLKLSNLYGISINDFLEKNINIPKKHTANPFKDGNGDISELEEISHFNRIIRNYQKLRRLAKANMILQ